ncbi:MAG: hypothetical protein EXR86_16735 [Gammaproteobacteria bacterium]|nr:hypothetical protein [Gammaproteobacteria bacterium]
MKVGVFAMSRRGVAVIEHLAAHYPDKIGYVVIAGDASVQNDYVESIRSIAHAAHLPVFERGGPAQNLPEVCARLAVAWRWMLPVNTANPLIVFHDSLLPRYRGFAPLVCALINGEAQIGVTALLGGDSYDSGPILTQESVNITYPLSIATAIEAICPCYTRVVDSVMQRLKQEDLTSFPQSEADATYSLWRDADDYRINWHVEAAQVARFIDATGFPYLGAWTAAEGKPYRVLASTALPEARIENRMPGKIFRVEGGFPIVVCGRGLLRLDRIVTEGTAMSVLPWPKLRTRFT